MAGCDVQEFLGGPRAPVSQLVDEGFTGCPGQEGSYHVGVGDVRELVALLGEALDVPAEGFIGLLAAVLEVPWVSRALVRALKISHKDFPQIRPTLEALDGRCSNHGRAESAKNSGMLRIMKSSSFAPPA